MTSCKHLSSETSPPGWQPRPWLFDKVVARHRKAVIVACIGILVLTVIENVYLFKVFLVLASWKHSAAFAIASLLFLPIGYGMSAFVLGIQVVNPLCGKRLLDLFCSLDFWFFGVGALLYVPGIVFLAPDNLPNLATPVALGAAWGAYAVHKKQVIGDSEKWGA